MNYSSSNIVSHVERGAKKRSVIDDLLEEEQKDSEDTVGQLKMCSIDDDVDATEIQDTVSALPDRRNLMKKARSAKEKEEWRKAGCSSEQSYRDLKLAMNASVEDIVFVPDDEFNSSISSVDFNIDNKQGYKQDVKPSGGRKDPWAQHGCSSEESYRNLKVAMAASAQDLDSRIAQKLHKPVRDLKSTEDKDLDAKIAEKLKKEQSKTASTSTGRRAARKKKMALSASAVVASSEVDFDLKRAIYTSMKDMSSISDSFRKDLLHVNGNVNEEEALQRAMEMSKNETPKGDTAFDSELQRAIDTSKNEPLKANSVHKSSTKYGGGMGDLEKKEEAQQIKSTNFIKKGRMSLFSGGTKTSDKQPASKVPPNAAEDDKLKENLNEKAQLKGAKSVYEDPLLMMESLTINAKRDKKKNSPGELGGGKDSSKNGIAENVTMSKRSSVPELDSSEKDDVQKGLVEDKADPVLMMDQLKHARRDRKKKKKDDIRSRKEGKDKSKNEGTENDETKHRSKEYTVPQIEGDSGEAPPTNVSMRRLLLDEKVQMKKMASISNMNMEGTISKKVPEDSMDTSNLTLEEKIAMKTKGEKKQRTRRKSGKSSLFSSLKLSGASLETLLMSNRSDKDEKKGRSKSRSKSRSKGYESDYNERTMSKKKGRSKSRSKSAPDDYESDRNERAVSRRKGRSKSAPDDTESDHNEKTSKKKGQRKSSDDFGSDHNEKTMSTDGLSASEKDAEAAHLRGLNMVEDDPLMMIDHMMDDMKKNDKGRSGRMTRVFK